MGISWPVNIKFGMFMNLMGQETYLMTYEIQLFGDQKFSWPGKTLFMGCVKHSSIIHGKCMPLNQGHEIDNCKNS